MRIARRRAASASLASSLLILTFGLVPVTSGADHLDSPRVSQMGAVDITDIYAFSTPNGNKSVFIIGVNPGAGVLENSGTTFGVGVDYLLKIDNDGDLRPDVTYKWRFGQPNNAGDQSLKLWKNGTLVASGMTGNGVSVAGGGKTTGDLYDDPFFFDLAAFQGAVLGSGNGRSFCDGMEVNFFAGLNLNGIVLRVPNAQIGGNHRNIGVWATTQRKVGGKNIQLDQMGRPAINTVLNNANPHKYDRELFNRTQPAEMVKAGFRDSAEEVLTALGAADPAALAGVLIPDVLTFETSNTAGFLNGRRLANDVIDAELGLVTNGAIPSDCVGNDSAFPGAWPYLAPAN
jgi:hypothetical protein